MKLDHSFEEELPPRARRILKSVSSDDNGWGTTSACAENTSSAPGGAPNSGNYLRVRGEYKRRAQAEYMKAELPPRARRIRLAGGVTHVIWGTTSACAENTLVGVCD